MAIKLKSRGFKEKILLAIIAAAILILSPFLATSIMLHDKENIIVDLIAVGGFFLVFLGAWFTRKTKLFNGLFAIIAYVNILVGIYVKGAGLIYWIFPIIIASFYLLPSIVACSVNFLSITIAFFLVYDQLDSFTLPRIIAALVVTNIFSLICSVFMQNQNHQLFDKDKTSQLRNNILELIASSSPLSKVLPAVTHAIENEFSDVMCSIFLLDETGEHLMLAAAPNLPDFYRETVDGLTVAQGSGPSGTAAYIRKRVVIADLATHSYGGTWKALAKKAKLVACWSEPVIDNQGNVLGVLSIYHRKKSVPNSTDFKLIEQFVNLVRIAIEREAAAKMIWKQANYDNLTKLPNRYLLHDQLTSAIANAQREETQLAIAMLDLDKFKEVNDILGHSAGDAVLIESSNRIKDCIRKNDIVARIGGDEFIIVLTGNVKLKDIDKIGKKLSNTLANPYLIQDKNVYCTASIGIAFYPDDALSIDTLFKNADQAMYCAKEKGRNGICYFTKDMQLTSV